MNDALDIAAIIAVLDTNAIVPSRLRDVLMTIADEGWFQPIYSERILDELAQTLRLPHLRRDERYIRRVVQALRDFPHALVSLPDPLSPIALPDMNDIHVVSAAVMSAATIIVTFNIRDFPEEALSPLGLSAEEPDAFLCRLLAHDADSVTSALRLRARR